MAKMWAGRGGRRHREAFATERAGGAAGDGAARLGGGRVGGGMAQGGRRDEAQSASGGATARRGVGVRAAGWRGSGGAPRQACGRRRGKGRGRTGRLDKRAGGAARGAGLVGGAARGGRECGRRRGGIETNEKVRAKAEGYDLRPLFSSAGLRPTKIVVGQEVIFVGKATFSSASLPTKITAVFLWAGRRKYSPAHKNTPHFRWS
jgi:hypothetical protein